MKKEKNLQNLINETMKEFDKKLGNWEYEINTGKMCFSGVSPDGLRSFFRQSLLRIAKVTKKMKNKNKCGGGADANTRLKPQSWVKLLPPAHN